MARPLAPPSHVGAGSRAASRPACPLLSVARPHCAGRGVTAAALHQAGGAGSPRRGSTRAGGAGRIGRLAAPVLAPPPPPTPHERAGNAAAATWPALATIATTMALVAAATGAATPSAALAEGATAAAAAAGAAAVAAAPAAAASSASAAALATTLLRPAFAFAELLFVVRIIMTWYPNLDGGALPWAIAYAPTEPLLRPTRAAVPPVGGVDVSPIIWFAVTSLASEILVGPQGILVLLSRKVGG